MNATSIAYAHIRDEILEKNYAQIPFPVSYNELSQAAEHFFDFLTLSDETKQKFSLSIDPYDNESVVGYIRKHVKMNEFDDDKEYFHYNRYAEEGFENLTKDGDPRVTAFFASAKKIYEEGEYVMDFVLREFSKEFPDLYQSFMPEDRHPHFYLRFLKYDVTGKGKFLAKGHYDYGGCTLALAESAPGLRIGNNNSDLKEVVHKDGHAIFMPGLLFPWVVSEEFHPAWHDVVQKSSHTYSEDAARWAIVFFADPIDRGQTHWEDRHVPLY